MAAESPPAPVFGTFGTLVEAPSTDEVPDVEEPLAGVAVTVTLVAETAAAGAVPVVVEDAPDVPDVPVEGIMLPVPSGFAYVCAKATPVPPKSMVAAKAAPASFADCMLGFMWIIE